MKKVSKIKVGDSLRDAVIRAVDEIGGFRKFIKTGDVVLLKPNFNTADPFPASTDFEFLKIMVDMVYDEGAKLVIVGDSCTMTQNTRKVMEKLGIFELHNMERPPRILVFEEREWIKKEVPQGKYLKSVTVPALLDEIDKLVLLPCLKTHFLAQFTGSLKLSVAFMKPFQRPLLHLKNLQEKIAELNKLVHPDLIIMDARKCFITEGPAHGKVRKPNLIMASTDRVATDIEGIKTIQGFPGNSLKGIEPEDLPQIKLAQKFFSKS